MLNVRQLRVRYGATEILSDVSFSAEEGRVLVTLLGGNGSGKTTLLNTISGLVRPASGSIEFLGQKLAGASPRTILRSGLAQVPQGREIFATLTVHQNLLLGGATSSRAETLRAVEDAFEVFPMLGERRAAIAGRLSGGEQQQLAMARARISGPKMLTMDEPSAGMSPIMVDRMIDTLLKLRSRRLSIFLIEQNVGVAAAVADDAMILGTDALHFDARGKVAREPRRAVVLSWTVKRVADALDWC